MASSNIKGLLDLESLRDRVDGQQIDTVLVAFPDIYGRLMGKRLDAQFFLETVEHGTHACNYLLTVDMEMEPVAGYQYSNWEGGYGDFQMVPDLSTLRVASWLEKTAMVICDVQDEASGVLVDQAPRSILRRQIERAAAAGYEPLAASEIEYYIFRESYRDANQMRYGDLEAAGWYIEDYHALQGARVEDFNGAARRHLNRSGVPVENTKGEWGRGQHELNVRYAPVLQMADRHTIYKQCLKELADKMGLSVTFMAKYAADQAGSSCHIHMSLLNGSTSAFVGDKRLGSLEVSDVFRWFLGGWIARAAELMVFYAPTVNSYKRYQAQSWAPTRLAWSHDNRTAGFRVVGRGESLRIECRIPGADCNPYLAMAAALASGLDGVNNHTEPPEVFQGDVYSAWNVPHVPRTLAAAQSLFEESQFARETFGDDVVEHYGHFFKTEQEAYDRAVTDWERARYFERI